ncbi:MAG: hypothetical protein PVJ04_11225 [Gemmatimonadota bacterium]|jgi:hypothetical protein
MTEQPLFTKTDADRILKRAAEIEGSEETRSLSLTELRSIAGEAGFGQQAVDRAIAEARRVASADKHSPPVRRSGLVISHLSTTRSVPVEASSEQLMRAVRLLQPYREGPVRVKLEERQLAWRDRKGLEFTVRSSSGTTEIRVYVSKLLLRRGKWMGWVKAAADRLETLVFLSATQISPSGEGPPGPENFWGEPNP